MQAIYGKFIALGDGNFKMASKAFVGNLEILKPRKEEQDQFEKFVRFIDKSRFIVQSQIRDLQELLDSKMDEYFGGDEE